MQKQQTKILISLWMMEGIGWTKKSHTKMRTEFVDVRRAYFHRLAQRDLYREFPPEDQEPGMCGKLDKSMYGARDAAQNWEEAYSAFTRGTGFKMERLRPVYFTIQIWI